MTNNQLTEAEITETLDAATSGYPLTASAEASLRRVFAELQERRKADSEPVATLDVQSRRPDGNKFALVFSSAAHKLPDDVYFLYPHAQPAPVVLKDHQIRELVNQLRDIAIEYHGTQQLRERIARVLRAAMLQAEPVTTANKLDNSPVIPDGYVMVPKEPTKEMLIRAVATMSGCAPSLVDESGEELEDMREVYLDILKVAPQLTIVENGDESQDIKGDVNIIISILKNGDWSDTDGFRGLKTEAGQALESEIEKIVALIEPSPTTVIDAIDAHLLKIFQGERGGQLLQKVENNNWIPVSERLPEEGGRYWCYVEEQNSLGKSHYQWNCSWNGEIWGGAMMYGRVTHWMPLPAAPQGVK
ncbi:DUF551 domain-containing protein [Klebsiella aerogenes]|uniref:DUF551 domain-containing protein n=1 Tax=Klebsiella aerogenes TaxID=548 RepID=UPI0037AB7F72